MAETAMVSVRLSKAIIAKLDSLRVTEYNKTATISSRSELIRRVLEKALHE